MLTTAEKIKLLEEIKEAALFQRKITTCLLTAMEYDAEIAAIERRIERLKYILKKTDITYNLKN